MQTVHIWEVNAVLDTKYSAETNLDFKFPLKETIVTTEKSLSEAMRVSHGRIRELIGTDYQEGVDFPDSIHFTYKGEARSVLLD
ncbi:hypothetical protein V7166_11940 [Bacillus thuringiensis]